MKMRFGRIPKHYQFEYVPRFYDPEEEKKRKREVDYSVGDPAEKLKSQIRNGLQGQRGSQFQFRTQRSVETAKSNRRLMFILLAFGVIGYLLWNSQRIERLLTALNGGSAL